MSQQDLAQSFHLFFTDKIKRNRDEFEIVVDLHLPTRDLSLIEFASFHEVSKQDVQTIFLKSPGTTSDLDPIPSSLLKSVSMR